MHPPQLLLPKGMTFGCSQRQETSYASSSSSSSFSSSSSSSSSGSLVLDERLMESEYIARHHSHQTRENQCSSTLVKHIKAPLDLVWSLVRRFDQPEKYKPFIKRCEMWGDMGIGCVRVLDIKSGLPASTTMERLELLDDNEHKLCVKTLGGDHRLKNYSSVVTLHPETIDGNPGTLVIESFVVDISDGNTKDETCYFVEAVIKCNMKSLADISERLAEQGHS